MKFRFPWLFAVVTLLVCLGVSNSIAIAKGIVRINQADGTEQRYAGSIIRLAGNRIRVFSPDSRDRLTISQTACSYVGEVERCLPDEVRLRRNGTDHVIGFDRGSVYFNPTAVPQPLPRSSTQLPPNGVLVFVRTVRGTSIAVRGIADTVAP
jgi:hypothetical protein